jgi:hypothetical protein
MKRKSTSKSVQRWRVNPIMGPRAQEICELEAKSAEEAAKRVIKEHGIADPHQQRRIAAYRVA